MNRIEFKADEFVSMVVNDEKKYIKIAELTPRAQQLSDNLTRMIDSSGKRITKNELDYILYSIVERKLNIGEEA